MTYVKNGPMFWNYWINKWSPLRSWRNNWQSKLTRGCDPDICIKYFCVLIYRKYFWTQVRSNGLTPLENLLLIGNMRPFFWTAMDHWPRQGSQGTQSYHIQNYILHLCVRQLPNFQSNFLWWSVTQLNIIDLEWIIFYQRVSTGFQWLSKIDGAKVWYLLDVPGQRMVSGGWEFCSRESITIFGGFNMNIFLMLHTARFKKYNIILIVIIFLSIKWD